MFKNILKIGNRNIFLKRLLKSNSRYFNKNSEKFSEIKNNAFNTEYETDQILKIQKELENEKLKNKNYNYNENFFFIIKNISILLSLYILYTIVNFLEIKKIKGEFFLFKINKKNFEKLAKNFRKMMELNLQSNIIKTKNTNLEILKNNFINEIENYFEKKNFDLKIKNFYLLNNKNKIFRILPDGSFFISNNLLDELLLKKNLFKIFLDLEIFLMENKTDTQNISLTNLFLLSRNISNNERNFQKLNLVFNSQIDKEFVDDFFQEMQNNKDFKEGIKEIKIMILEDDRNDFFSVASRMANF